MKNRPDEILMAGITTHIKSAIADGLDSEVAKIVLDVADQFHWYWTKKENYLNCFQSETLEIECFTFCIETLVKWCKRKLQGTGRYIDSRSILIHLMHHFVNDVIFNHILPRVNTTDQIKETRNEFLLIVKSRGLKGLEKYVRNNLDHFKARVEAYEDILEVFGILQDFLLFMHYNSYEKNLEDAKYITYKWGKWVLNSKLRIPDEDICFLNNR
ncbi:MAG: hypothetical protein ACTSP1_13150 [Candidatus Freyarchaeota archaeon]